MPLASAEPIMTNPDDMATGRDRRSRIPTTRHILPYAEIPPETKEFDGRLDCGALCQPYRAAAARRRPRAAAAGREFHAPLAAGLRLTTRTIN